MHENLVAYIAKNWVILVEEGLVVMLVGMGVVFAFLIIMVIAMGIMTKIVEYLNKVFPEKVIVPQVARKSSTAGDEELIAVAIAAIKARG